MNKITIIGNLGKDPEMTHTPEGQAVTRFSLASNRRYKTASGESREETEWFNVSAWGKLAELCNEYLTKGRLVYLEGRLHLNTWEADGQRRFANEIRLTEVQFLGGRPEERGVDVGDEPAEEPDALDDLPF